MAPGHVAYGLSAQYGLPVTPETVIAWERGDMSPTSAELTALAGVLWCSPGELLARATTLREHRIAGGLAADELARRVGMDASSYLKMEESGRWRGNERQSAALAEVLGLSLPEFVTATGKEDALADVLRNAVTTRWQAYLRPLAKLLPVPKHHLEDILEQLYNDYQSRMVATLSWGGGGGQAGSGDAGREFLAGIVARFWDLARGTERDY
ncbi:helix-turn-helix domain-containing protein [Streptomyces sp. A3M-1-3]|uniref:helix-turn-helix domain-containing protein n=1 Tax=Streptomyces sp. A3M-1-3 TaxID=2962044 RepID=UPI0020B7E58D|nr:helix-turn-helix domain-containing protein [Streptomyces sp. A3M-1-3]MCP3816879.1 helix-turn-helix domain-containing protein [Streptomyces sp. A3M-1-3]